MRKFGIFKIYFYALQILEFGIHADYKSLEISMIWYNLIIDWTED